MILIKEKGEEKLDGSPYLLLRGMCRALFLIQTSLLNPYYNASTLIK